MIHHILKMNGNHGTIYLVGGGVVSVTPNTKLDYFLITHHEVREVVLVITKSGSEAHIPLSSIVFWEFATEE